MNLQLAEFLAEHTSVTRRYFLRCGTAGVAAMSALPLLASGGEREAALKKVLDDLETWLTIPDEFRDVSRGNPKPHSLDEAKRKEVGLTRDTWKLEVVDDPENKTRLRNSLTKEDNTAFTFDDLMKLAKTHAVRFPKVMTCLNIGCPLGNGIWEGVPLRHVLWLTEPSQALRRIYYYGYHNDDEKQMFRSSLPVGRVLEDPFDLPPVILCYKLNGELLNGQRGAPVRMVVPEAYGFKSVKWLNRVVLSNLHHANDTYANGNNDLDSWMKTFARSMLRPESIKAGQPIPITGYAQVGISGLAKVQTSVLPKDQAWPADDPYYTQAKWTDGHILPPPERWGGGLDQLPLPVHGFKADGQPLRWPLRLTMAHWAAVLPGLPAGEYTLRCRSIDDKSHAQPMPRPFRKSGRNAIEEIPLKVT